MKKSTNNGALFYRDTSVAKEVTWGQLLLDLAQMDTFTPYCKTDDYYQIFLQLIFSMLTSREITLLDADFSDEEVVKLLGHNELATYELPTGSNCPDIPKTPTSLIEKLQNTGQDWSLSLYTSGTTGLPKRVKHGLTSITRQVKYHDDTAPRKWGFAYNPTHMAGLQVFYQALLNGDTMIRLFGFPPETIREEMLSQQVTHISATPTFYRLHFNGEVIFESVRRATSGGEKMDVQLSERLQTLFPKATVINVYASTEAGALFAATGDIFSIREEVRPYVKVQKDELLIHHSLLGEMEIDTHEWYASGDVVEVINVDPLTFRFVSRQSDIINIGGYNVVPLEVEECLKKLTGVVDASVYAKSNSVLGNILCAEVVTRDASLTEADLRKGLMSSLQEFKIPRLIKFVEKIGMTRTGKVKRSQ
ncbi:MAG: long-chain fatty acid--CoA ligase [Bacteroidota bacterium]